MNRLQQIAEQIEQRRQPPVHLWKPQQTGSIDIQIDAQGFWFHEGDPIERQELVNLFASILWYENQQHYLVTPVEKLALKVADVPFIIHQAERIEGNWVVVTNNHEQLVIGQDHPVELRLFQRQWVPYINVRYDLWARVNRSIYYQWASSAVSARDDEEAACLLQSGDYTFEVARE